MVRDRADHRRLNPIRALADGVASIPRAARSAWAVLAFWTLMLAAPLVLPVEGAVGIAHGMGLWLTALVAVGTLFRLGVSDTVSQAQELGLGAGGLQIGAAEARIAWGSVLILIFLGLIGCILALVALAVFGMAELDAAAIQAREWTSVGPGWKLALLAIVTGLIVGIPVLLITRLSLFAAASVARRRTVSLDSMAIATGSGWALLGVLMVIAVGPVGLGLLMLEGLISRPLGEGLSAVFVPWLWAPFATAALSSAYRQLEYWTPSGGDGKHYRDLR